MTKQERANKAQAHYEDIKTRLAADTKLSIERTYEYGPNFLPQSREEVIQKPSFTLVDMDSVSCLFNLSMENDDRVAILNSGSLGLWFHQRSLPFS